MLSQRIALASYEYSQATNEETRHAARSDLTFNTELFLKTHLTLSQGAANQDLPSPSSAKLIALYHLPTDGLDKVIKQFVQIVQRLYSQELDRGSEIELADEISQLAKSKILPKQHEIVLQLQLEDEQASAVLLITLGSFSGLALVLLYLEAKLIFAPLTKRVATVMESLSDANKKIEQIAIHDELTGLLNRLFFDSTATAYLQQTNAQP